MSRPPAVLFGIPAKEIARICQVDLSTARRWKRGAICLPKTAAMILSADLGIFDPAWRGWCARRGELISPEGWSITVNDVLASPLLRAQLAVYQAQLRTMREDAEGIEEQPLPGEAPAEISA